MFTKWIDRKYIGLLSYRLEGFVWKSSELANSRCPICGDSKSKKNKKRFYFYTKGNQFFCRCHNCSYGSTVKTLLKELDYKLYQEYNFELFTEKKDEWAPLPEPPVEIHPEALSVLQELKTIEQLRKGHFAKEYVLERKLPLYTHSILRWCPKFKLFTNYLVPEKFEATMDEGRLIIPYFDQKNTFFAYSGRTLNKSVKKSKYIHIVLDKTIPFFYGMNTYNPTKKGYVTEGQFDSMFLPNAMAMGGSNILSLSLFDCKKLTIILDNEPRKNETIKKCAKAISLGYQVCIWPKWVEQKDINSMIMDVGWSPEFVKSIIDSNTFSGLEAKLKLENWRKV